MALSKRIARLISETPGAEDAYLTNAYIKVFIESLDIQWETVVAAAAHERTRLRATLIADEYVRLMLKRYVADAAAAQKHREVQIVAAETAPTVIDMGLPGWAVEVVDDDWVEPVDGPCPIRTLRDAPHRFIDGVCVYCGMVYIRRRQPG